jgi:hypothetical protein
MNYPSFKIFKILLPEMYSFEIRPGPVGRPETRLTQGWNRVGLKKNMKSNDLV